MCAMHLCCYEAKRPNLKLQTRPKQLLVSLPDFTFDFFDVEGVCGLHRGLGEVEAEVDDSLRLGRHGVNVIKLFYVVTDQCDQKNKIKFCPIFGESGQKYRNIYTKA